MWVQIGSKDTDSVDFGDIFRHFFARSSEFDAILFYERNVYFYDKDLPDFRDPR